MKNLQNWLKPKVVHEMKYQCKSTRIILMSSLVKIKTKKGKKKIV